MTDIPLSHDLLDDPNQRVIIVTGPSGGGRTTAINVLEDMGFEIIINLPLRFLPRLLDGRQLNRPLALGLDVRNRDYSVLGVLEAIRGMRASGAYSVELLFVECDRDALIRRYSETRRRHPMAEDDSPHIGIDAEVEMLRPIRDNADVVIDTTHFSPHDLKRELAQWYGADGGLPLALTIESFSYKRGLPQGTDVVFDCRFLRNPHWEPELRAKTGLDDAVAEYVGADPLTDQYFEQVLAMTTMMLPAVKHEGRAHLTIGFGCTGGKHRSVTMAEKLAKTLAEQGWQVSIRHREMDRWAEQASGDKKV